MASNTRQVIIGNSGAALSALKAIRSVDSLCPVCIITDQNERAYSPVLTTYYIAGKVPKEKLYITQGAFYNDLGVDLISGKRAESIDTASQNVILEDGSKIGYDNLLIATGASAKKPTAPGGDLPMVRTLRTLEDADSIKELAGSGAKDVVVIGAGLVSLQIADAIYGEGMNLTFLVGSKQILSQNIDENCARIINKQLDAKKAKILFGVDVEGIEEVKGGVTVVSKTGERYRADMVVVGKGVAPNTRVTDACGIEVDNGILVDEYMKTNLPNIYAAGDVAEGIGLLSGRREIVATWYNACHQGRIAGWNMAGKNEPSAGGLNRNITTLFGITVASVGEVRGSQDSDVEEMVIDLPGEGIYRKFLIRDDQVRGSILLGRISDAGMAENLIANRVKIPPRDSTSEKSFLDLRQLCTSETMGLPQPRN